jgi:uncharacterized protein YjbI with pentapeptide repeats
MSMPTKAQTRETWVAEFRALFSEHERPHEISTKHTGEDLVWLEFPKNGRVFECRWADVPAREAGYLAEGAGCAQIAPFRTRAPDGRLAPITVAEAIRLATTEGAEIALVDDAGRDWGVVTRGGRWEPWQPKSPPQDYPDLQHVYLERAHLEGYDLAGAILRGAHLGLAELAHADLRRADLRGAIIQDTGLEGANLRGAIIQDADARRACLRKARLQGANLQNTNLQDADFRGAILDGADLTDADLLRIVVDADTSLAGGVGLHVPVVEDLDGRVMAAMGECRGVAWMRRLRAAVELAGRAGRRLLARVGLVAAGTLIYAASTPDRYAPNWHEDRHVVEDVLARANKQEVVP